MPKPGYASITVTKELKDLLQEKAKQNKRTIPKEIEFLVDETRKKA